MITYPKTDGLTLLCREQHDLQFLFIIGDDRDRVVDFATIYRAAWNEQHPDRPIAQHQFYSHRLFDPTFYMARMLIDGSMPEQSTEWPFARLPDNTGLELDQFNVTIRAEGSSISDVMCNLAVMCAEVTHRLIDAPLYYQTELNHAQPTVEIGPDRVQHWKVSITFECPIIHVDNYYWIPVDEKK